MWGAINNGTSEFKGIFQNDSELINQGIHVDFNYNVPLSFTVWPLI